MPARNAYRVSLAMEHKNKLLPNIIDVQSILQGNNNNNSYISNHSVHKSNSINNNSYVNN